MKLEQQLKQAAEPWLAEENLSQAQADELAALVGARSQPRLRPRFRWGTFAAAAAAVVLLVGGPVVTGIAADLPLIGPYLAKWALFDRGANWANDQGYITPVGQQVTLNGYTLRVEGVLADAARTQVFWAIEGPNLKGAMPQFTTLVGGDKEPGNVTRSELIDGRLVGSTQLPALQDDAATLTLRLTEVAGVRGPWEVSFDASRAALDAMARTVPVGQTLKGEGYALTVSEVVFAPSETLVRLDSTDIGDFEILWPTQLLADGVAVQGHVFRGYLEGKDHWDLAFDRLEGEPAQLTLRIGELGRYMDGGPVLDLTTPGATAEAEGVQFTLRSVALEEKRATVTLGVAGADTDLIRLFDDWTLTDAEGLVTHPDSWEVPAGTHEMILTFGAKLATPVKLEAKRTLKTIARDLEFTLPTK